MISDYCNTFALLSCQNDCSAQGTCLSNKTCECNPGYEGVDCAKKSSCYSTSIEACNALSSWNLLV